MAVAECVRETLQAASCEVVHNDLYAAQFSPLMAVGELGDDAPPEDTRQQQRRVSESDVLIFVFPIWWWSPPAILQGWLERVMSIGFAFKYDVAAGGFVGQLAGRTAIIISSSGSDPCGYPVAWQRGSHLRFVSDVLEICGIETIKQFHFHGISAYADKTELTDHLAAVRQYFQELNTHHD